MPTPEFIDHINTLAEQAGAMALSTALSGPAKRTWQIPASFPDGVDIQDPEGFVVACDRSGLNILCELEYNNSYTPGTAEAGDSAGRLGVVGALKTAIDYQAVYERALHARHASPIRCRAWASARRAGHADSTRGVFGCVLRSIDDTIGGARSIPNTQS